MEWFISNSCLSILLQKYYYYSFTLVLRLRIPKNIMIKAIKLNSSLIL
jgi:hypothetical protein